MVGDIVILQLDEVCPADLLILDCDLQDILISRSNFGKIDFDKR
jgi:magnesium-transporting ATPase (P-type)